MRRDMVVLHRSDPAGITRFKKFGCSLKSKPINKSMIIFDSVAINNSEKYPKLPQQTNDLIKNKNKEKAQRCSLRSDTEKVRSTKFKPKRKYKSEGL